MSVSKFVTGDRVVLPNGQMGFVAMGRNLDPQFGWFYEILVGLSYIWEKESCLTPHFGPIPSSRQIEDHARSIPTIFSPPKFRIGERVIYDNGYRKTEQDVLSIHWHRNNVWVYHCITPDKDDSGTYPEWDMEKLQKGAL